MRLRWSVFGLLLGGFAGPRARAQAKPEEVARAFFAAQAEGRWHDAARLLDLSTFRRILDNSLKFSNRPAVVRTADDLIRFQPDMPREVAEYQVRQLNERNGAFNPLSHDYAGVTSRDTLAKLPIDEAAARWLQARSPEWQRELAFKEATRRGRICDQPADSMKKAMVARERIPKAEILGTVTRDSIAYVLVSDDHPRAMASGTTHGIEPSPSVLQLIRVNDTWRVIPTFDMPNAAGGGRMVAYGIGCDEAYVDKRSSK